MPLLIASLALIIAATAVLIVVLIVLIGWLRQDRVLRRMRREIADRASASREASRG
jgi:hypothetical protein